MTMCDIKLDCTHHNRTNTANTEICNEYQYEYTEGLSCSPVYMCKQYILV